MDNELKLKKMSDDDLVEKREELIDQIEIWLGHEHRREDLRELLEIERELTLREE
jgi:hypothetical protein